MTEDGVVVTFYFPDGFDTAGNYPVYAMVDTWDQISEGNELDNVSGPVNLAVSSETSLPTPTPTPSPTPAPVADGEISGSTWLFINGDFVPQGRVNVYCYDGSTLVAEALSDAAGNYAFADIPPGTYTLIGQAVINGSTYSAIRENVIILSGELNPFNTLILSN